MLIHRIYRHLKQGTLIKPLINKIKNINYSKINDFVLLNYLDINKKVNLIDIGAYKGDFTDIIKNYCGIEKSILVEPIPLCYDNLIKKYKNESYINIIQSLVTDKNTDILFNIYNNHSTSSILGFKQIDELSNINIGIESKIYIKSSTLDSIFLSSDIKNVDVLKIDVQGAEHLILKGAKKTLEKTKILYIEVSFKPLYDCSSIFHDIYCQLNNSGFFLVEIIPGYRSDRNELLQADALFFNKNI